MASGKRCAHHGLVEVDGVARWCSTCGSICIDRGPLAARWIAPKTLMLERAADQLRRVLEAIEVATIEDTGPAE